MLKVGIDVLNRDFCVQIGYNRRAVKTYGSQSPAAKQHPPEGMTETVIPEGVAEPDPLNTNVVS